MSPWQNVLGAKRPETALSVAVHWPEMFSVESFALWLQRLGVNNVANGNTQHNADQCAQSVYDHLPADVWYLD